MRKDLKELLLMLSTEKYHTALELAEKFDVSTKTIRGRIKELNEIGTQYGVSVQAKARYGFLLVSKDTSVIEKIARNEEDTNYIPITVEERENYLLMFLLNHPEYIKVDDICEFLCVSRSTIQNALKHVEVLLNQYQITIDRKPNYGVRALGNEFDFRRCIAECVIKRNIADNMLQINIEKELEMIGKYVIELMTKYNFSVSENLFDNMIIHIYVAMKRIKRGYILELSQHMNEKKCDTEYLMAQEIALWCESIENIHYSQDEIAYISIYLAGVSMYDNSKIANDNFVVREDLNQLVIDMLELIWDEFSIDLRKNFSVIMALNQHMVPFDVRIRYQIGITNPLLDEIKQKHILGYTLSRRACSILEAHYRLKLSEDEIGYFAMLFAFGIEQEVQEKEKFRILIVCGMGRGSAQLIRIRYEQEFKEYIRKIYICGIQDLKHFDFNNVDCVFTTVSIQEHIPIPIIEVGQFLESKDILKVRNVLEKGHVDFLDKYYKENQFLLDIEGNEKEEVIRNICEEIEKQRELPEGFCEAVIKREELAPTSFGNKIAMPHPYKVISKETFVYVAILKHEIIWNGYPVQLIVLSSVGKEQDENITKFYKATMSLFTHEEVVNSIILERKFEVLMLFLRQLYHDEE